MLLDDDATPAQALRTLRWLWGASVVGQVIFAGFVAALVEHSVRDPARADVFFYIAIGLLMGLTLIGYFTRGQVYKRHWREHAITPRGYLTGNIVLFALIECVSLFALVSVFFTGDAARPLAIVGLAIVADVINYPTGRPMRPVEPKF